MCLEENKILDTAIDVVIIVTIIILTIAISKQVEDNNNPINNLESFVGVEEVREYAEYRNGLSKKELNPDRKENIHTIMNFVTGNGYSKKSDGSEVLWLAKRNGIIATTYKDGKYNTEVLKEPHLNPGLNFMSKQFNMLNKDKEKQEFKYMNEVQLCDVYHGTYESKLDSSMVRTVAYFVNSENVLIGRISSTFDETNGIEYVWRIYYKWYKNLPLERIYATIKDEGSEDKFIKEESVDGTKNN
jgi:hypothetical protein